jgi:hypothetical protein
MAMKKRPTQNPGGVGYGRPPVHTRFRKGQSSNPTGRRRQGEAERANKLILTEAFRLLTLREGDKITRIPALRAVIRSQIAAAAKGNVGAQRTFLKAVQDIEAETRARRTGGEGDKVSGRDVTEMTDEELMALLKKAQDDAGA